MNFQNINFITICFIGYIIYIYIYKHQSIESWGVSCDVVSNELDCNNVLSGFEVQWGGYVHFQINIF